MEFVGVTSTEDLISKEDPNTIYTNMKKVGEGAAGEVFLATDSRKNLKVAIKKMELNNQNVKLLVTEIGIMKTSVHPNIVQYYESYLVGDKIWVLIYISRTYPPRLLWSSWEVVV